MGEVGAGGREVVGAGAQVGLERRVERGAPAPAGDDGRGLLVAHGGDLQATSIACVPLALLAQEEGQLQPALEVAGVDRTAVGAHGTGQVAEVLEDLAEVAPGVGLAAGQRDLVGVDRLGPPLLGGEGVAEVERADGVAQVGGAAEAPLGVGLPADVGQVAAEVDQGVGRRRRPAAAAGARRGPRSCR